MDFMKKTLIAGLVFLSVSNCASAQFYLNLGAGYALPAAGQTMDAEGNVYNGSINNTVNYNMKSASFAAGLWGNVALGYMGGANIGVQLDAGFGLATKKYTFNNNNIVVSSGPVYGNESIVQQAKGPFIVTPSFVIQSGGDPWNFYGRLGIALPLDTKINQDQIISTLPGQGAVVIQDVTFQIKNSFSLGYTAAVGVQYKVNDRLKIFGECSILSMSQYIKESDFKNISVSVGGVGYTTTYQGPTVTKYSKNATYDTVNYAQLPSYSQPFSNVAFAFGVSFRLSEQKQHHSKHRIKSDNARLREERDY